MKILITYELTSMNGFPHRHVAVMRSLESAEATCQMIEDCGYKIIDVSRDCYED